MTKLNYISGSYFVRTVLKNTTDKILDGLTAAFEFNLPKNSIVSLSLSDASGNMILKLIDEQYLNSGSYQEDFDFTKFPRGEYYYKFQTKDFEQVKGLQIK